VISTLLAENAVLVRIFFWVAVAAFALVGWVIYRSGLNRLLLVLAVVSLAGMFALTLSPSNSPGASFCTVQFSTPFRGIDTLANVAMTVPLALFATLWCRRPLLLIAAVSGLSALVELLQALAPALGRACDTDDWVMNTVGAATGALLAVAIIALRKRGETHASRTGESDRPAEHRETGTDGRYRPF